MEDRRHHRTGAAKTVRLEPTPDSHTVAAILWGPLVLAGDMGPRREGRGAPASAPTPLLVGGDKPVTDWVVAAPAAAGLAGFQAKGVARIPGATPPAAADVSLVPFYRADDRTYTI